MGATSLKVGLLTYIQTGCVRKYSIPLVIGRFHVSMIILQGLSGTPVIWNERQTEYRYGYKWDVDPIFVVALCIHSLIAHNQDRVYRGPTILEPVEFRVKRLEGGPETSLRSLILYRNHTHNFLKDDDSMFDLESADERNMAELVALPILRGP